MDTNTEGVTVGRGMTATSTGAMSRKPKAIFTTEETVQLTELFDAGLDSVSKEKAQAIRDAAQKLKKTEQEIKNWIGNERSRRKRSSSNATSTASPSVVKKAPQKLRAPNPYNMFVQDFFKSTEGKSISSLGEKNRVASSKWRSMEPEDKNRYQQMARQVSVDLTPDVATTLTSHYDKLHETRRVVTKIQENCDWAAKFGVHICYMACVDKHHFAGGTERGYQFLSDNPHLVGSFITSTKPGITPVVPVPGTKQELRSHVEDSLNLKYALAIRQPNARVPYSLLKAENVIGLPTGVLLKHPSHLKQGELQAIYSALPSIKFIDVPPVMHHVEHSYARAHHDAVGHVQVNHDHLQPSGFTTLASVDNTVEFKTTTVKEGDDVHILSESNTPIGTATIMAGNKLHGNDLPVGFVKIAIKDINISTSVIPWPQIVSSFDDDEVLINGSITGWPQNKLAILT